ncbi:MAG: zinc-ribbon domain-containing protein [Anaerolineae bacterium]|nr:zinc-ribbon domain-containing protein [Anaerolineae bacterium]
MSRTAVLSHCTNCGNKLRAEERFCTKCGTPVKRTVERGLTRFPVWIWVVGALVLAVAAFLLISALRPSSTGTASVPDVHDAEGIPYPEVPRLSVVEAKTSWDVKNAVFVDVRGQGDYTAGHIANAVSLPLAQIEAGDVTLPRQAEILTYCT